MSSSASGDPHLQLRSNAHTHRWPSRSVANVPLLMKSRQSVGLQGSEHRAGLKALGDTMSDLDRPIV